MVGYSALFYFLLPNDLLGHTCIDPWSDEWQTGSELSTIELGLVLGGESGLGSGWVRATFVVGAFSDHPNIPYLMVSPWSY